MFPLFDAGLMTLWIILLAAVGLCLGSFASAIGHRVPRGESWIVARNKAGAARSQCPHCGYGLRWYDLVPVVSWVSLGGRCRSCRQPIGILYPVIEILGATLSVALFFVLWVWLGIVWLLLMSLFMLPFYLAALVMVWQGGRPPLSFLLMLGGGVFFWLIWLLGWGGG